MQELVLDPKKFPDPHNDHPLNQHEDSSWHAYFRVGSHCSVSRLHMQAGPAGTFAINSMPPQDAEMMQQIDRDVMRTHPDMHFFSGDGETSKQHREVCNRSE